MLPLTRVFSFSYALKWPFNASTPDDAQFSIPLVSFLGTQYFMQVDVMADNGESIVMTLLPDTGSSRLVLPTDDCEPGQCVRSLPLNEAICPFKRQSIPHDRMPLPKGRWDSIAFMSHEEISGYTSEVGVRLVSNSKRFRTLTSRQLLVPSIPILQGNKYIVKRGGACLMLPDGIFGLSLQRMTHNWSNFVSESLVTPPPLPAQVLLNSLQGFQHYITFIFGDRNKSISKRRWLESMESWATRLFRSSDSAMIIGSPPLANLSSDVRYFNNPCHGDRWCVQLQGVSSDRRIDRGDTESYVRADESTTIALIDTGTSITALHPILWDRLAANLSDNDQHCQLVRLEGRQVMTCDCESGWLYFRPRDLELCIDLQGIDNRVYRHCIEQHELLNVMVGDVNRCQLNINRLSMNSNYGAVLGLNFLRSFAPILDWNSKRIGLAANKAFNGSVVGTNLTPRYY